MLARSTVRGLLLLVALEGAAAAESPSDRARQEAERRTAEGLRLFAAGSYPAGIEEMEQAYRALPHPAFLLNIAVGYEKWGGHCAGALEAIARFTSACDRCSNLALGREVAERLQRKCEVPVIIETEPAGAKLQVEGFTISAPAKVWLTPGLHTVTATLAGRGVRSDVIVPGELRRFRIMLSLVPPLPSPRLAIIGAPRGHLLALDGGRVSSDAFVLTPGTHTLKIEEPDTAPRELKINLAYGQTQVIDEWSESPRGDASAAIACAEPPKAERSPEVIVQGAPGPSRLPWIIGGFLLGGVGATTGAILTAMGLHENERASANSFNDPVQANQQRDRYGVDLAFAQVAFAAAVLAAGTAIVLAIVD